MDCNCPESSSLVEIVAEACGVDLKQIQRLAFQRHQATPSFDATTVLDLAEWQALLAATDATKIVITPKLGGDPVIAAGEPITTGGGDNSTMNGVEEVEGTNPANFTAFFKSLSTAAEVSMKPLNCEKALTVYLILQGGRIGCWKIEGTPDNYTGMPIQSFFLSDRNNEGYGTKDRHNVRFSLEAGYSEKLDIVTPTTWNPLTDL